MKVECLDEEKKSGGMGVFERYLTVWVGLCIVGGIALGKLAPGLARSLDEGGLSFGRRPATTVLIFGLGNGMSKAMVLTYENAAPTALIGASNHFEVAIATVTMLYGLASGAALATVVGVLIEIPVMLMLVKFCVKTQSWFPAVQLPRPKVSSLSG